MNRPSFLEGAGVALAASVLGAGALVLLLPWLPAALLLQAIAAATGLGYLLYLLRRAPARSGRVSLVGLWLIATLAAIGLHAPLPVIALVQLAVVWLARALYFHAGPLAAGLDLGLCAISLAAAAWAAQQSDSLALTLWCLMLVQAAFVLIPDPTARRSRSLPPAGEDPFLRAHRAAEAALRRLASSC